ncbi:MAG: BTAD domain-containing putative transcriptional regulator [Chloroflexaceae bacterium]
MGVPPEIESLAGAGYAHLLEQLGAARVIADQLGDQSAIALLEALQRLCATRATHHSWLERAVGGGVAVTGATARLSVHFLGRFRASLNGQPINNWRKKSEALFKYLVLQRNAPVHRDRVCTLFWPEADPQAARNCLNVTLHALRKSLNAVGGPLPEGGLILFTDDRYQLNPAIECWCDTDLFVEHVAHGRAAESTGDRTAAIAAYEMAAALYSGDLLADDRYEEWVISPRERLRISFLAMLQQLGLLYAETRQHQQAIAYAQKILAYDNCHEEAHRLIMRCYAAQGQRSLAMRQYALCRETLARELGLQPMQETEQLAEMIRSGR